MKRWGVLLREELENTRRANVNTSDYLQGQINDLRGLVNQLMLQLGYEIQPSQLKKKEVPF